MPAIFYCNEILNLLQEYFRFFKDLFCKTFIPI